MPGIYVHIPFCRSKCPYCDFVSYTNSSVSYAEYVHLLEWELEDSGEEIADISFDTIYIGGGTPSLLPGELIARILDFIFSNLDFHNSDIEVSIEANPESMSREWLEQVCEAGVNRLSLGIQDFSQAGLERLGRPHDLATACRALDMVLNTRFRTISLDLIYGIPGQKPEDLERSLRFACTSGVHHLSCYELTVEPGTVLWYDVRRGHTMMLCEETLADMTDMVESILGDAGYRQYEISNFSLPGRECRHNLNYWENGSYTGIGCSAVSFVHGTRTRNTSSLANYRKWISSGMSPCLFREKLDREESFRESIVIGLRCCRGISCKKIERIYGIHPVDYYGEVLDRLMDGGLLSSTDDMLFLTRRGRRIANTVLSILV